MVEKIVEIGVLYDFYGKLLSDRQREAIELYYLHDLSLSEIGENLDISRQGAHDLIKRAESNLYEYENKLKLIDKFEYNMENIRSIMDIAKSLEEKIEQKNYDSLYSDIESIKSISSKIVD